MTTPINLLQEKPVGICPACGQTVFNSLEPDGPVWICPTDLHPQNPYWQASEVTKEQKEQDSDYSNCPSDHHLDSGECHVTRHLPLHGVCYDKGVY